MCVQIIDQGQQIQTGETRSVCANSGRIEPVNTNLVPGPVNTSLGPGPWVVVGGQGQDWGPSKGPGPGNTNTLFHHYDVGKVCGRTPSET